MKTAEAIPIIRLLLILIPVLVVIGIYSAWSLKPKSVVHASFRMILQLLLCGYVLNFIFFQENFLISAAVLAVMMIAASWIALRPLSEKRGQYFWKVFVALILGGIPTLALVVFGVIELNPWYHAQYLIPLAGMIFANSMNAISLCAERFFSEKKNGSPYFEARSVAYKTSMIPLINSFFAVGIVSFPGMMTGQILAGVSPLIAIRYQILVMCMLLGSAGISSAIFLVFLKKET